MRALVASRRGGPDELKVTELPDPVPDEHRVLIEVRSAGLNFSDIQAVAGYYPTAPAPPWTPGHEVAGIDRATGEPVIAYLASGGYAELAVAERGFTFPAGDLDLSVAGGQVLVSIGAMLSLRDAARLRSGETLLITAAAGGIGTAAIKIGRLLGAGRIIAVASTEAKRAFALRNGADEAIGYDEPVPPIDVLFDTVGDAEGFDRRVAAVRQLGRIMLMGASSGHEPVPPPPAWLKERNVAVVVFSWGALRRGDPERAKRLATEISELIRAGSIALPVTETVTFEDVADAYRRILARATMGKLVFGVAA